MHLHSHGSLNRHMVMQTSTVNGLQLGTQTELARLARCWTECANMEQKLWAVALILALLKTKGIFFNGGWRETEPWEGNPLMLPH